MHCQMYMVAKLRDSHKKQKPINKRLLVNRLKKDHLQLIQSVDMS